MIRSNKLISPSHNMNATTNIQYFMKEWKKDRLCIHHLEDRVSMGEHAAAMAGDTIKKLLGEHGFVNIIFAAAPSQNEFLAALSEIKNIAWHRVNAFHMDEYIGLPVGAPQTFRQYLDANIFYKLPFHAVNYLDGNSADLKAECKRYQALLEKHPTHVVCMGIGENGHVAFNDPHVANFEDPHLVKIVDLDFACRQQQVNDGCFQRIEQVPTHALTLTIPALMRSQHIFCIVPGRSKANAVFNTLNQNIESLYPSTILRKHPRAVLYIDNNSASLL